MANAMSLFKFCKIQLKASVKSSGNVTGGALDPFGKAMTD